MGLFTSRMLLTMLKWRNTDGNGWLWEESRLHHGYGFMERWSNGRNVINRTLIWRTVSFFLVLRGRFQRPNSTRWCWGWCVALISMERVMLD